MRTSRKTKEIKTRDIIDALEKMKERDPEKFYDGMGYELDLMDSFFGGSYEFGLVVGAKFALEKLSEALYG